MNLMKDIKCPSRNLARRADDTVDKFANRRPSQRLESVHRPRRKEAKQVRGCSVQGQAGWILDSVGPWKGSRAEVNPNLHVKPYTNPQMK